MRRALVEVGDEHVGAFLREPAGEVAADRADALHEHAPAGKLGRAEHVLDARPDPVQHAAGGAARRCCRRGAVVP